MWFLKVRPGKVVPYVPSPEDNPRVHISQACLTPAYQEEDGLIYLFMKQNSVEDEEEQSPGNSSKDEFVVISCLSAQNPMANLDLLMDQYAEFQVWGNSEVHLSGYFMPDYIMDDEEDEDYIGDELEEGDEQGIENRQNSKQILEDGFEDDEDEKDDDESLVDQFPKQRKSCMIEEIGDEDVKQETDLVENQKPRKQQQQQQGKEQGKKQKKNKKKRGQQTQQNQEQEEEDEKPQKKQKLDHQTSSNLQKGQTKTFPNGFQIQQKQVGFDDAKVAKQGKTLKIAYVARLGKNGKIVDKSKRFTFKLGHGQVIIGMEEGCRGMKVGDERIVTVPPEMAYGSEGVKGSIPQNATMQFEIALLDVK